MSRRIRAFTLLGLSWGVFAGEPELWQPYYVFPRSGDQHVDLSADWSLTWRDRPVSSLEALAAAGEWIQVKRPMSVQMALYYAGRLPHPYVGLNSSLYGWVTEKAWYYRRYFPLTGDAAGRYVFLCFDGIDYFARVWLNGKLLGRHEGMFGGPIVEVSRWVKAGAENELLVEVLAANWEQRNRYLPRAPGRIIKPWVIAGGTGAEMFFPLGMWQGARVEIVPRIHLERPFLTTLEANGKSARLKLSVEVFANSHSLEYRLHGWENEQQRDYREYWRLPELAGLYVVELRLIPKEAGAPAVRHEFPLKVLPGRNWLEREVVVPQPLLWWPNGLGEPRLYLARVALKRMNQTLDAIEFDYGIRTLRTERTAGPRTADRWANWQFVVNGRRFFVKGVNWMPADILLDLPHERYHWLMTGLRNAGIQMVRVWGGGLIEPEAFYQLANKFGILVWQDFPIANMLTPDWPQPVWEAQVVQTIFRIRNHPALAMYCGGNEFNPYAAGNAASIGIFERSVLDFDGTRPYRRASPDAGSMHDYPDMDPAWYARKFSVVPFMSETGMHNIPDPETIREVVSPEELARPIAHMFRQDFGARFPELRHHFVEFQANRVPRMLSRASHIIDLSAPMLEELAEASQIGAGEFYQLMSEALQANYPVTAGLMPWVYKRPWPVVAIQLVDGFGQPTAPYYFLKRTYEPTHIQVRLPYLLWTGGEKIPVRVAITHAPAEPRKELKAEVSILEDTLVRVLWKGGRSLDLTAGPTVAECELGEFRIPADYLDRFLFMVAELRDQGGMLISRSVYWPRSLGSLADAAARQTFRDGPREWPALSGGPWLKPTVERRRTGLRLDLLHERATEAGRSVVRLRVENVGSLPAFPVKIDVYGGRRAFFATDNFFWLPPGESREIDVDVLWRDGRRDRAWQIAVSAWNAEAKSVRLAKPAAGP